MATLPRRIALGLALVLAACHSPEEDYQRFLDDTAEARKAGMAIATSHLEDVSGRWLVSTLLAGGLALGLRMRFTVDAAQTPAPLVAEIWTTSGNIDTDPPITTLHSVLEADGRFVLRAEPLELKMGAVKGLNVDVSANIVMDCYTQTKDEWCGGASGKVVVPLDLDLMGSTLGASRDDAGTKMLPDVPVRCPGT